MREIEYIYAVSYQFTVGDESFEGVAYRFTRTILPPYMPRAVLCALKHAVKRQTKHAPAAINVAIDCIEEDYSISESLFNEITFKLLKEVYYPSGEMLQDPHIYCQPKIELEKEGN